MDKLFCDLKTDIEKANFFLSGKGFETGVIAKAIQNDVAMAYQRCHEYAKENTVLTSPKREWVGLTDEEISASVDICEQNVKGEFLVEYARAIEAKLKEKNT